MGSALFPVGASAHPHIWVEAQETLRFDPQGRIEAVLAHWTFDDLYSAFSLDGLDVDGDGSYTAAELEPMRSQVHASLRTFGYFTTLTAGDEPQAFAEGTQVTMFADGGILRLDAVLPLAVPVDPRTARVTLQVSDPSYYIAFDLAEVEPARLAGAAPDGCRAVVDRPRDADEPAPTLSDDRATDVDLARSYAADDAATIRVICA